MISVEGTRIVKLERDYLRHVDHRHYLVRLFNKRHLDKNLVGIEAKRKIDFW